MKKEIIIGGLIVVLAIIVMIIGVKTANKPNSNQAEATSKTAEVVVEAQGSIPYDWDYTIEDESIIKFKELKEDTNDNSDEEMMLGAGKQQHYIFEGLKEGKTTIKFELKSFVSTDIAETKNFDVSVDKDLKVTITEKN